MFDKPYKTKPRQITYIFDIYNIYRYIYIYYILYIYIYIRRIFAINKLQWLICHNKSKPNINHIYLFDIYIYIYIRRISQ